MPNHLFIVHVDNFAIIDMTFINYVGLVERADSVGDTTSSCSVSASITTFCLSSITREDEFSLFSIQEAMEQVSPVLIWSAVSTIIVIFASEYVVLRQRDSKLGDKSLRPHKNAISIR